MLRMWKSRRLGSVNSHTSSRISGGRSPNGKRPVLGVVSSLCDIFGPDEKKSTLKCVPRRPSERLYSLWRALENEQASSKLSMDFTYNARCSTDINPNLLRHPYKHDDKTFQLRVLIAQAIHPSPGFPSPWPRHPATGTHE